MQFSFPKFFGANSPGTPQKSIFLTAQARVLVLFDISKYLTDKYLDIVWGCPPGNPPKNPFFEWLKQEFYFFLISVDI